MSAPSELKALVDEWQTNGKAEQERFSWPHNRWLAAIPEATTTLEVLPNPIGRSDVRTTCSGAASDPQQALEGFVAAMVWGYGSVGYGPWRTRRAQSRRQP